MADFTKYAYRRYIGAHADTKPTGVEVGSICLEYDTDALFVTYDGTNWVQIDKQVKLAANSGVDIGDVDVTSLPSVATATPTKISVGSSDTQILVANASRKFAVFVNDSDEVIYLSLSATAVINEGIRLNAHGGAYEINLMNLYTGEVAAICSSGTKNLTVTEG